MKQCMITLRMLLLRRDEEEKVALDECVCESDGGCDASRAKPTCGARVRACLLPLHHDDTHSPTRLLHPPLSRNERRTKRIMGCAICLEEYEADNANPALQAVALRCGESPLSPISRSQCIGADTPRTQCLLPAGHIFHQKCIQDWLSSRASAKERCCAMCKAPSDFEQYARSVQAAAAPNAAVPSNEYIVLYPAEMEEIDKFLQQRNAHVARCREIQRRREAAGGTGGGAADEAEQKREEEQLGLLLDFRMHLNAFVMGVYRENAKTVDFAALKLIREVALLKGEEGTAALKVSSPPSISVFSNAHSMP